MREDPYYTLDKVPVYRQEFIDLKVKEFIRKSHLKKWPLDFVEIILDIIENNEMPITIKSMDLTNKTDAVTIYLPDLAVYHILVNKSKITYPFKASKDRRLNFTLAHEIGHICLGHKDIPDCCKSKEIKEQEDLEADEFAGRVLMPISKIVNLNFSSLAKVAEHFNVSESAVLKRLTNLKMHKIRSSRLIPVCESCGNSEILRTDDFCNICGSYIKNHTMGVSKMKYDDGVKVDEESCRVFNCPTCHNREINEEDDFCIICGTPASNECSQCGKYAESNARYCRYCGSSTVYYQMGLLEDWKIANEALIDKIEYELNLAKDSSKIIPLETWEHYVFHLGHGETEPLYTLLEGSNAILCGDTVLVYVANDKYKDIILSTQLINELEKLIPNYLEVKANRLEIKTINEFYDLVKKEATAFEIPF